MDYRKQAHWLIPTAMGTDKGIVLVETLIEEMRNQKIIPPAIYAINQLAWFVLEQAKNVLSSI